MLAPELYVETSSAVHRLVQSGALGHEEADGLMAALGLMPLRAIPHAMLLPLAWRWRERVRIADAFYVACAQLLGVPLLTSDARLGRADLPGVTVTVVR
ncbi:MAG: type II toxin-antitoxin system VapC family toxin [Actinomycetota bacterium]|nr:type II toxin-antitoxin system VapC family toxin [Actinomycetota bacterium]